MIKVEKFNQEGLFMTHSIADGHNNSRQQRTVLLATDNNNSVLVEIAGDKPNPIAYSAYGQQSAQQEVATRLGFNGELREAHIGWYLLGNGYRAYNPRLMRFHSPDNWSPFGQGGLNAYMYCMGDPINSSDPTGHGPWDVLKLAFRENVSFGGSAADLIAGNAARNAKALVRQKAMSGLTTLTGAPVSSATASTSSQSGAVAAMGMLVGGAPGPRGTGSLPLHNLGDTGKKFPGYGAGGAGSTLFGTSSSKPARTNPNLLAGPLAPPSTRTGSTTSPGGGTYRSSKTVHGRDDLTFPKVPGGGDPTGTHPRDRMVAVADRDRVFVEHRIQMRREALIAAMQVRNAQLLRAGQPPREFRMPVLRRESL